MAGLAERPSIHTGGKAMITDFDDVVTWMYVLIDDLWQPIGPLYQRPGSQPECSDSEFVKFRINWRKFFRIIWRYTGTL
jgi:hypothetical protein